MRGNKIAAALLSSMSVFALATIGLADPPEDILAFAPGFKPTLNFSDTYSEKILTIPAPPAFPGEPREPATHEQVPKPQKITAKVVANITGFDFSEIADEMPVNVYIGGFLFESSLGDSDEAIKNGGFPRTKKKATYSFIGFFDKPNGDTVEKKVGSLVLSWTATRLTVTLSVSNIEAAGLSEIGATQYIGLYVDESDLGNKPSGSAKFVDEPIDVSVSFGSASGVQTAFAKGTSATAYKKYGSDAAGTLEEFFLESAKIIGKAGF